ncbi:MAG TPA: hypothetical protein VGH87_20130 [Polyangiaceae bacterium]
MDPEIETSSSMYVSSRGVPPGSSSRSSGPAPLAAESARSARPFATIQTVIG